ncbi:MAG: branched chain amino acid aminotransferase, partial [Lachnospiraceae bacterium]|nr:branched chain amino acid aminotransferase [Lachnospiraceae bacterium]
TMEEVFGTGNSAVISPVSHLRFKDHVLQVKDGGIGKLSQKLYDTVAGLQRGQLEDHRGWVVEVK